VLSHASHSVTLPLTDLHCLTQVIVPPFYPSPPPLAATPRSPRAPSLVFSPRVAMRFPLGTEIFLASASFIVAFRTDCFFVRLRVHESRRQGQFPPSLGALSIPHQRTALDVFSVDRSPPIFPRVDSSVIPLPLFRTPWPSRASHVPIDSRPSDRLR